MTFEVLVTSMGQKDLSLPGKMNIACPALVANQCDSWGYEEQENPFGPYRMVSSATRGVGRNRNYAISLAKGDILLFADDDIVYYDSDLNGVKQAFKDLPDADVILFSIDMTRNGEVFDKRRSAVKRLHWYNAMKYGACRMAIRREALVKHNLSFSTLFGGGCQYGSGEDSLFLLDCFSAGLRVYSHSYVLGACAKDSSTWFNGYDEKFFFDKGAWLACAFPKLHPMIKWHFIRRFHKKTKVPYGAIIKYINAGIRSFPKLKSFEEAERIETKEG